MPKDILIPHEGNNFRPHLLRPKRAFLYSLFFVLLKLGVVAVVLGTPAQVLTSPQTRIQMQRSIIELTNQYRSENNLPLLRHNRKLYESSFLKSRRMQTTGSFAHNDGTGFSVEQLVERVGYTFQIAGENLALGKKGPTEILQAWMASPTHNANLLNPDFRETGVSVMPTEGESPTYYVTHHFATAADEYVRTPSTSPFINYDSTKSKITWNSAKGQTTFFARAHIDGPISYVQASIGNTKIPMAQDKTDPLIYEGSATADITASELLDIVVEPTLYIADTQGQNIVSPIAWDSVTAFELTPLQYYLRNKSVLRHIFQPLFNISNTVYIVFTALFMFVLMITISYEFTQKRYHSIGLSFFVILLLSTLIIL